MHSARLETIPVPLSGFGFVPTSVAVVVRSLTMFDRVKRSLLVLTAALVVALAASTAIR